jgi:predicted ATPase/serine phosphatase RsbU (regulator of sigma subunit)
VIELGPYVLLTTVSQGAANLLYRGYRTQSRLPVIAKIPRGDHPTPKELAKLRHEHAILRELDHPGIPKSYDLLPYRSGTALIIEDKGFNSLTEVMRDQKLSISTILNIFIELAEILDYLHRKNIIHKDIKPQNIVVHPQIYKAQLIDFGIAARLARESLNTTKLESLEGTLTHISPEQTGRTNRAIDARTDFYSLGVTLYEMLTGTLPFTSTDALQLVHSHIARTPAAPHDVVRHVPVVLSRIVMKLMAKNAEDRYQSAAGLQADLTICRTQWEANGQINEFPLDCQVPSTELRIPQKLYGREEELGTLLQAFERVRQGSVELLLTSGYSGIGKSALVQEVHGPIAREGGYFIAGKFDQLSRSVPYAPVTQALRTLVRQFLTESIGILEQWRYSLHNALHPNAQILIDLLPELGVLLGPQPSVPELGPAESQNRFIALFQSLLRVLARPNHPLVMFLDDLQWADPATLRLLQHLLLAPDCQNLLIISSYRDNEVTPSSPLTLALNDLRREGVTIGEVKLEPLSRATVERMLCDTLNQTAEQIAPLVELLHERTQGNPFFLGQFLSTIHKEGLLWLDAVQGIWRWDMKRIRTSIASDNVVDLMLKKLRQLSPDAQETLQRAACVGHQFDLQTLSNICEKPLAECAAALWQPMQTGLLLPLDDNYRYLFSSVGQDGATGDLSAAAALRFKFLHDRVQQAAYALIDDAQRAQLHLRIGRLLHAKWQNEAHDETLFATVDQLNRGASLITTVSERIELARLNLLAGKRAKAATAYQIAASYLELGMNLLGDAHWDSDYELCFGLWLERAESEYLNGSLGEADALFSSLRKRARSRLDTEHLCSLHMKLLMALGKFAEAMDEGLETLVLFGVNLRGSDSEQQLAFEIESNELAQLMADRQIDDLINTSLTTDPDHLAVARLMNNVVLDSYFVSPAMFARFSIRQVILGLHHGFTEYSSYSYICLAYTLAGSADYSGCYQYLRLALALNEKLKSAALSCKINVNFAVLLHFSRPMRETIQYYDTSIRDGMHTGDLTFTSWALVYRSLDRYTMGQDLPTLLDEVSVGLGTVKRNKDLIQTLILTFSQQRILRMMHGLAPTASQHIAAFDEDELVQTLQNPQLAMPACYYHVAKLELAVMFGNYELALEMAEKAAPVIPFLASMNILTEYAFYKALALSATATNTETTDEKKSGLRSSLVPLHDKLVVWATSCPANYHHQERIVAAEIARIDGNFNKAMDLYDDAITHAQEQGFLHQEGLANELCAKFYLSLGRERTARAYLQDAYHCYARWGARAKAAAMVREYPQVLQSVRVAEDDSTLSSTTHSATVSISASHSSGQRGTETLDIASLMRASHAISGEIEPEKVLGQIMQIMVTNAGAQRGFLLLQSGEKLIIKAKFTVDPDEVQANLSIPLDDSLDLSRGIAYYVARTREVVVLGNAAVERQFFADAYVASRQLKSVLALPMIHRSHLVGVLYFENGLSDRAFTPSRTEILTMLGAQAAVALENSRLLGSLRTANEAIVRANDTLEQQVAQRTQQLQKALSEIWSEMDLARKIQTVLLPTNLAIPRYDIAAVMRPCATVGGDYYDVFIVGGVPWIFIGDVSGHGVSAGLSMMMIQTAIRTAVTSLCESGGTPSPAEVIALVNLAVRSNLASIDVGHYMTITGFRVEGDKLVYAGLHEDILIYRAATRAIERVETTGVWLGVLDDIRPMLVDGELSLAPGDTLLLYTDGVTEVQVGEGMREAAGLGQLLATAAADAPAASAILGRIVSLIDPPNKHDDETLLVMRRQD